MAERTVYGTVTFPFAAYVNTEQETFTPQSLLDALDVHESAFVARILDDYVDYATAYDERGRVVITGVDEGIRRDYI